MATNDIRRLTADDVPLMEEMLTLFGETLEDRETYDGARPGRAYLERLVGRDHFIALAACDAGRVIGGIAAYVLDKFERERTEIYI